MFDRKARNHLRTPLPSTRCRSAPTHAANSTYTHVTLPCWLTTQPQRTPARVRLKKREEAHESAEPSWQSQRDCDQLFKTARSFPGEDHADGAPSLVPNVRVHVC